MSWKIKALKLPDKAYHFFGSDANSDGILHNLSKVNIIVGENNSGKSRLLRALVNTENLEYLPAGVPFAAFDAPLNNLITKIGRQTSKHSEQSIETLLGKLRTGGFLKEDSEISSSLSALRQHIKGLKGNTTGGWSDGYTLAALGRDLEGILDEELRFNGMEIDGFYPKPDFKKIYVPILRGLRSFSESTVHDVYEERTRQDYFAQTKTKLQIVTGLGIFEEVKKHLLGNLTERKLIKQFEEFLSQIFFDNRPIALIPADEAGKNLTIKIGDEHERPIYNLGDGLQSIIIITFQLFINRGENVLAFIEEPEQLMHPGLQRKLLETFYGYDGFENFQFFLTTHSNHFLDITLDFKNISVFSVKKKFDQKESDEKVPEFAIENLSHGDLNALELLGVRNSSVFLSNSTIWVEGITDRYYIRHYLELYRAYLGQKNSCAVELREDFHYSFVEYGGSNITHWSFLNSSEDAMKVERLCAKLFLIADKDEGKKKRHAQLKELLSERFYLLRRKEIENLIEKEVLLKVLRDYEGVPASGGFDYNEFKYEDYANEYLGKFIEGKILKEKKRRGSYQQESGTITDKVGFCQKALLYTTTWEDLSKDAKELTKKVYEFIVSCNTLK